MQAFGSGMCPYAGDDCVVDGKDSKRPPGSSAVLPASESHMSSQLSCTWESRAHLP